MSITYETFLKPDYRAPDYLRFLHPKVDPNAQKAIEKVWDMTIPTRPRLLELEAQAANLARVRATANDVPDLRTLVETITDPEELQAAVDQAAVAHARRLFVGNAAHSSNYINNQLREEQKGAGQFDHILSCLPLEQVEEEFITAARALGDTAYSAEAALNADPEALRVLTENGHKLSILANLRHAEDNNRGNFKFTRLVSMFSTLPDLPDLPVQRAPNTGTAPLYTPEDRAPHDVVLAATDIAHRRIGIYLVALAQGKFPGLDLKFSRSWAELRDRRQIADKAGRERLDMKPNRTITPQTNKPRSRGSKVQGI